MLDTAAAHVTCQVSGDTPIPIAEAADFAYVPRTMQATVFIDGQEGTTGLEIRDRLAKRSDLQLLEIDPAKRKDAAARRELLNAADAVILCLPDEASREAVAMVENPRTRIYDASTAHRTAPGWTYGLPEREPGARAAVAAAKRVTVPGCHATAFVLAVAPLVRLDVLSAHATLSCHSITGYSGGGKKRIAQYQSAGRAAFLSSPNLYSLGLRHKHLPEMQRWTGLAKPPAFSPIIGDFYRGMAVSVPMHTSQLARPVGAAGVHAALASAYAGERFVKVLPFPATACLAGEFQDLDTQGCNGTNRADIVVFGSDDYVMVSVRIDNLGKGASGACVQCLNLGFGFDEGAGLTVE
jgi:N-acetyl-gamma-glutamyl-phosphate reductase